MKTVLVTKRSKSINDLLKQAMKQNVILRSEDGREFILAEVDDFDREIELARQNKDLMKYLDERGKEKATIPLEDLEKELGLAG
ncbi:MAG: hypothetical protein AB1846_18055 [Chloroflexota bacterium]